MRQNPKIEPDFHLAAMEETQYWDDTIIVKTGRIWTIYLYDNTEHTYLCEMRPSLALHEAYFFTEKEIDDATDQEVREAWERCRCDSPMSYYHVSDVTSLKQIGNIFRDANGELIANWNDEKEYQETIDNYISEMTCNGEPLWWENGSWRTSTGPVIEGVIK